MSQSFCRERRSWTAKEDQLLREAVQKGAFVTVFQPPHPHIPLEDPDNANPSKWHAIAKHVPNRTNKDCRKRWFAKMASDVVKGGWSPEEDERLVKGIERYGTRYVALISSWTHRSTVGYSWSLVASIVQTRNSDRTSLRFPGLPPSLIAALRMRKAMDGHIKSCHRQDAVDTGSGSYPRFTDLAYP